MQTDQTTITAENITVPMIARYATQAHETAALLASAAETVGVLAQIISRLEAQAADGEIPPAQAAGALRNLVRQLGALGVTLTP